MIHCSQCPAGAMAPGHAEDHDIGPLFGLDSLILPRMAALVCDKCGHLMIEGEAIETARQAHARRLLDQSAELRPDERRFVRQTTGFIAG